MQNERVPSLPLESLSPGTHGDVNPDVNYSRTPITYARERARASASCNAGRARAIRRDVPPLGVSFGENGEANEVAPSI